MTETRKRFPEAAEDRMKTHALSGGLDHNSQGTRCASADGKRHEEALFPAHGKKERIPRQTLSNLYILKGADWVPRINIK